MRCKKMKKFVFSASLARLRPERQSMNNRFRNPTQMSPTKTQPNPTQTRLGRVGSGRVIIFRVARTLLDQTQFGSDLKIFQSDLKFFRLIWQCLRSPFKCI